MSSKMSPNMQIFAVLATLFALTCANVVISDDIIPDYKDLAEKEEVETSPIVDQIGGQNLGEKMLRASAPLWLKGKKGSIPYTAFVGGESSGGKQYVARATHDSGVLPGKLIPSLKGTYVAWDGQEYFYDTYEVLSGCSDCQWVSSKDIPTTMTAVAGGKTEIDEELLVCRVDYQGTVTLGRALVSRGLCYIPFNSMQLVFSKYDVLAYVT